MADPYGPCGTADANVSGKMPNTARRMRALPDGLAGAGPEIRIELFLGPFGQMHLLNRHLAERRKESSPIPTSERPPPPAVAAASFSSH